MNRRGAPEFDRGLASFDTIYGLALTLLVVVVVVVTTIDVTGVHTWTSLSGLLQANGTEFTSVAISFSVIAAFWKANLTAYARSTGRTR